MVSGVGSLSIVVQKIQRPVVHKWVKFNPGLGETLNKVILISRIMSAISKMLLKLTD